MEEEGEEEGHFDVAPRRGGVASGSGGRRGNNAGKAAKMGRYSPSFIDGDVDGDADDDGGVVGGNGRPRRQRRRIAYYDGAVDDDADEHRHDEGDDALSGRWDDEVPSPVPVIHPYLCSSRARWPACLLCMCMCL